MNLSAALKQGMVQIEQNDNGACEMNMSKECLAAFENYQAATNEQDQSHWFGEMIRQAPTELQKTIRDMAVEMGLLP